MSGRCGLRALWYQLLIELGNPTPVLSAETTRGREAELIDERLPRRARRWLVFVVVAALASGAAIAG